MILQFRHLPKLLKKTFKLWNAKDPFRESAVIAYFSIFSIPALLVIVINVAGLVFSKEGISNYLYSQIAGLMGPATAESVKGMIAVASTIGKSVWATIAGIAAMLMGATGVFAQLQKSLNTIWEVKANPTKENILTTIKMRVFSFGLIVSISFLLLVSLVISTLLSAASEHLGRNFSDIISYVVDGLNYIVSFGVITVLFALIYKVLPDVKITWSIVWTGAMVTALLFVIGKFAIGLYSSSADPGSVYGAAGSVILILLWVSYSSMIVFFGAEFTKVYADQYQRKPPPKKIAVKAPGRGKKEE